jgi:hypothetical protein
MAYYTYERLTAPLGRHYFSKNNFAITGVKSIIKWKSTIFLEY